MDKKSKLLNFLYMLFAALLVCSNCIAAKQIPIGIWFGQAISITAGIICYPFTFLITDIIGELYGKTKAKLAVYGGIIAQVLAIALITLANFLHGDSPEMNTSFASVLGSNWILTIGSLLACLLSQSWDVFIFHKIRDKYIEKHGTTKGGKWIWNNLSTISSQLIDSIVFYIGLIIMLSTIGVTLSFSTICITIFAYWVIKITIALIDTPLFYLFTKNSPLKHEEL